MGHVHETRLKARRNLFVAADLRWENGYAPVRIRNISDVGALVEADALPRVEQAVELVRGDQSACGSLVWVRAGKAGVAFLASVDPELWLPSRMKVRRGEGPILLDDLGASNNAARRGALAGRDLIVAQHLARIRGLIEDVRLDLSITSPTPNGEAVKKLDVIHRLLDWQVGELQP